MTKDEEIRYLKSFIKMHKEELKALKKQNTDLQSHRGLCFEIFDNIVQHVEMGTNLNKHYLLTKFRRLLK